MRRIFRKLSTLTPGRWAAGFSTLHLGLALFYKHVIGIDIQADPTMTWDWLWHALPREALRTDLWTSLWNLHSQPPLYNLYGALFARISSLHQLQLMQYANIVLGSMLVGMIFLIAYRATSSAACGIVAGLLVGLHPGLFLAEAYVHYDLVTTFLVVSTVFFLSRLPSTRGRPSAFLFVGALVCLVLTRSLFSLVLLPVALVFVYFTTARARGSVLLGCVLLCLLPVGWCTKNYVKFGFFGSSSWYGLNLWNAASFHYAKEELEQLVTDGVLDHAVVDPMTEYKRSFFRPSTYEKYGFTRESEEAVLSRDDYNNINIPAISRFYFENSLRLIRYSPAHYLGSISWAYAQYSSPPFRDPHHRKNIERPLMHLHEFLYYRLMGGQWLANQIGGHLGRQSCGSFFFVLFPAGLVTYSVFVVRRARRHPGGWVETLRSDAAMAFGVILMVYTAIVGCTCEVNENARFKFLVEPLFLTLLVVLCYRLWGGKRGVSPDHGWSVR